MTTPGDSPPGGAAPAHTWLEVYRGYDAEALAIAAGPGPVRRARKDLDAGAISWDECSETGGTVHVGDTTVTVDGAGLHGARCLCPTSGLCRHVLAACLWLHDATLALAADSSRTAQSTTGTDDTSPASVAPLTEVLELEPAALLRAAGVAAQRTAAAATAKEMLCTVETSAGRLSITWPGLASPVLYIAGSGLPGMVSHAPEHRQRALHLEALARVQATHGVGWAWPDEVRPAQSQTSATVAQHRVVDACQEVIALIVGAGLSHLTQRLVERLMVVSFEARATDLPLLSRLLDLAAGDVRALASRSDDMSEGRCAAALASVWVLAENLRAPHPGAFPRLHGVARRRYVEGDGIDAVPVGATWWTSTSGSRGLTVTFWDRRLTSLTRVTTGRAAGTDPGFQRDTSASLVWGASLDRVLDGPFRLTSPRESEDGSLSASASSGFDRSAGDAFSLEELRGLALDNWSQISTSHALSPRLGTPRAGALLLAPAAVEPVRVDEVRQHLVWSVLDADGRQLDLRQPVTSTSAVRNRALLTLPVTQRPLLILVEATVSDGAVLLEPTNLFAIVDERLRLVPLDFPQVLHKRTDWWASRAAATRADALLTKGHELHTTAPPPARRSLAERVCRPALDVLEALCATGRPSSVRQREVLIRQAVLARDVALDAVADALDPLCQESGITTALDTVGHVMHAVLVLDRTLQIGADQMY